MGMFLADLAFAVELITIALGFYFLYLAKREKSQEIKIGAYILLVGGIGAIVCTTYYTLLFWNAGKFAVIS